jgi:hypothetical protein
MLEEIPSVSDKGYFPSKTVNLFKNSADSLLHPLTTTDLLRDVAEIL